MDGKIYIDQNGITISGFAINTYTSQNGETFVVYYDVCNYSKNQYIIFHNRSGEYEKIASVVLTGEFKNQHIDVEFNNTTVLFIHYYMQKSGKKGVTFHELLYLILLGK